jgi:hypothetical protein
VNTIEELLERKSSGSGIENQDCGHMGIRRADYENPPLYPQKLALTSPKSGGRSVGRRIGFSKNIIVENNIKYVIIVKWRMLKSRDMDS